MIGITNEIEDYNANENIIFWIEKVCVEKSTNVIVSTITTIVPHCTVVVVYHLDMTNQSWTNSITQTNDIIIHHVKYIWP